MGGPNTLRGQLILVWSLFLIATLGTLGVCINAFNQRAITEQSRDREELFVRTLQTSINQVLFAGKYQAQAYLETTVGHQPDVAYVEIVDAKTGVVIAHSDPRQVGRRLDDAAMRNSLRAIATGGIVEQRVEGPDGRPIDEWAAPYERGYLHERQGVIRVGLSAERRAALQRQSLLLTLGLVLLFLAAGVALAVGVGFRLTAGLQRLTAAAGRFGEGRYDELVAVPETPRDELDRLGVAFNAMAERLGDYAEHMERQVRDRTAELATANRDLRESETRLTAFLDNASALIFLKDLEGRYLMANLACAASMGVSRAAMIGHTDAELQPPDVAEAFRRGDVAVMEAGHSLEFEEDVDWMDGAHAYMSVKFPLRDAHGEIYAVGGIASDITVRKRLEHELRLQNAKLKELDALKNEFVNAVSHDLRTPLTSIRGYAEFLEDEIGGALTPEQQAFVAQIQFGTRRLETLVDDLLDAARIEAGTFRLRLATVDLREPTREIVESLRPQAEEAGLSLAFEASDAPLEGVMDERRIQQIVTNLLHNAIKFTPAGGRISVRVSRDGDQLRGEVADTGPGIAASDIPRLFQRFSQLNGGRAKGGTGLGLAISKSIAEAHDGAIGVTSGPGGSTFWFTLPVAGPASAPTEPEDDHPAA